MIRTRSRSTRSVWEADIFHKRNDYQFLKKGYGLWRKCHNLVPGAVSLSTSQQFFSRSRNSQFFMETESSLPCSQERTTGLYSEPDESSPYSSILSKIHFKIILLSTFRTSYSSLSFRFSYHALKQTFYFPWHPRALSISSYVIWSRTSYSFFIIITAS
jgi:hypothetical protein